MFTSKAYSQLLRSVPSWGAQLAFCPFCGSEPAVSGLSWPCYRQRRHSIRYFIEHAVWVNPNFSVAYDQCFGLVQSAR